MSAKLISIWNYLLLFWYVPVTLLGYETIICVPWYVNCQHMVKMHRCTFYPIMFGFEKDVSWNFIYKSNVIEIVWNWVTVSVLLSTHIYYINIAFSAVKRTLLRMYVVGKRETSLFRVFNITRGSPLEWRGSINTIIPM